MLRKLEPEELLENKAWGQDQYWPQDLYGYAAGDAAEELVKNWAAVTCDGIDTQAMEKMIVGDINETIGQLLDWKIRLVRSLRQGLFEEE